MKKFFIAAALSLLIFSGQADAAPADDLNVSAIETQEMGSWTHFRDKYILGRETENERRDRKEWERRHHHDYDSSHRHHHSPPPHHHRPSNPHR